MPSFNFDSSWLVGTRLVGRAGNGEPGEDGSEWGESTGTARLYTMFGQALRCAPLRAQHGLDYRDGGRAVFDSTGNLLMLDGNLYDTRTGMKHVRFDKLSILEWHNFIHAARRSSLDPLSGMCACLDREEQMLRWGTSCCMVVLDSCHVIQPLGDALCMAEHQWTR